jgi:hypothetical protein
MRSGSREASAVFSPSPPPMMRQHSPRAWPIPVESRARLCHRIVLSLASSAHTVVLLAGKFVGAWHPPPDREKEQQGQDGRQNTGRHCTQHPCGSTIFGAGPGCMHDGICLIASVGWSMPSASGLSAAVSPREMMDGTLNIEISNIEYRTSLNSSTGTGSGSGQW